MAATQSASSRRSRGGGARKRTSPAPSTGTIVDRFALPAITAAVGIVGGLLLGRASAHGDPRDGVRRASTRQLIAGIGRRIAGGMQRQLERTGDLE
jgi:hypothetical protein